MFDYDWQLLDSGSPHCSEEDWAKFVFLCDCVSVDAELLAPNSLFPDSISPSIPEPDLNRNRPVCGCSKCQVRGVDVGWHFMVWSQRGKRHNNKLLFLECLSNFAFYLTTTGVHWLPKTRIQNSNLIRLRADKRMSASICMFAHAQMPPCICQYVVCF